MLFCPLELLYHCHYRFFGMRNLIDTVIRIKGIEVMGLTGFSPRDFLWFNWVSKSVETRLNGYTQLQSYLIPKKNLAASAPRNGVLTNRDIHIRPVSTCTFES